MSAIKSERMQDGGIIRINNYPPSEKLRSVLTALFLAGLLIAGIGCDSASDGGIEVDRIIISKDVVVVAKGASTVLDLSVVGSGGNAVSSYKVSWSSSNPSIVSVDQEGRARGVARGKAIITATVEDKTDTVELTIVDVSGKWTATVPDAGAPGGTNIITYTLSQNGTNVSGTYSNLNGFPPLTSVNVGQVTGKLTVARISTTLTQSIKVTASPCNLIWESTMTVITQGDGSIVMRPVQDPVPLTSDNCSINASLRVGEVQFIE